MRTPTEKEVSQLDFEGLLVRLVENFPKASDDKLTVLPLACEDDYRVLVDPAKIDKRLWFTGEVELQHEGVRVGRVCFALEFIGEKHAGEQTFANIRPYCYD